ncbi:DUF962-domain-containing protein [Athelia psychrophila]|uniref:DUF962-domain-containing protein n=1 Tax=Athelia psychrophila TaxID=1759441 RepID=A0A166N3U8_9AGAM|nr:DUF962-domain-containing protein [Fibularhizoctonia sp. CBS 109695]
MSSLFDIRKQFTFYGAYHTNPVNVAIHIVCVPLIIWSLQVFSTSWPMPSFLPVIHHEFNDYLVFDLKFPTLMASSYLLYYLALEPIAALIYAPQLTLSLLTATAYYYHGSNAMAVAGGVHALSWIAQFIGHGVAEKRAPALLDNVVGAVVLAPFFVHLEVLFHLGYRPALHKEVQNDIGKEVTRIRKIEGDKKRAAKAKKEL